MSNTGLNINKAFREQVENNLALSLEYKTTSPIIKIWRKENTCILSLLMFNENIKNMISKVLSSVVYCIMDNYACDDYLCCQQSKLRVENRGFKKQNIQLYFRNRNYRTINEHHFMS